MVPLRLEMMQKTRVPLFCAWIISKALASSSTLATLDDVRSGCETQYPWSHGEASSCRSAPCGPRATCARCARAAAARGVALVRAVPAARTSRSASRVNSRAKQS